MHHPMNRLTTAPADPYVIERKLGEGGMAPVCLAPMAPHRSHQP